MLFSDFLASPRSRHVVYWQDRETDEVIAECAACGALVSITAFEGRPDEFRFDHEPECNVGHSASREQGRSLSADSADSFLCGRTGI